LQLLLLCRGP